MSAGTFEVKIGKEVYEVDAKDENARSFYLSFGFIPLNDSPMQLFLPLKTLLQFDGIALK